MCATVHHLIEVSLLSVFWRVKGINVGQLIIVIRMLLVYMNLTCIVCVCMYTGQGPMPGGPYECVGWGSSHVIDRYVLGGAQCFREARWMYGEAHCV